MRIKRNKSKLRGLLYAVLGVLLCAGITLGVKNNGNSVMADERTDSGIEVHFIDAGQGDATLIKTGNHAMLIDSGCEDGGTKLQMYLTKQGVEKLDYLILTHPDSDHIGGADVIINKFECGMVMMPDLKKNTSSYRDVQSALKYKNYDSTAPKVGDTYELGNAKFTILAPCKSYEDANNNSIALILKFGNNSFLFTGDAEEEAEEDILNNGIFIKADVYKAGHHGSKSSSTEEFVDAISPEYAVISCGEGNDYGHPHAQTLNTFRIRGIKVFRTDEQGSIIASSDGSTITWNSAPSDTWQAGESAKGSSDSNKSNSSSEAVASAAKETGSGQYYILNTNTYKFHRPDCKSVSKMAEKNKEVSNASREDIISQGYSPCKNCNP